MNFTQVTLLGGVGHLIAPPDWSMGAHQHERHELIVVLRGVTHVWIGGEHVRGTAGDVWLYPRLTDHRETGDPQGDFETLFFSFQAQGVRSGKLIASRDTEGRIRQMALWMSELLENQPPRLEEELQNLTRAILVEFLRNREYRAHDLVTRLRRHMREHVT
ncbi:MAG: cupin domain-containing protein, partial [Kiritimatiellae bacterium]|nr:cupin domain-containing protein [Kiritimatiellia bacterium]